MKIEEIEKMSDEELADLMDSYGSDGPDQCSYCEEVTHDPFVYYWIEPLDPIPGVGSPNEIKHEEHFCSIQCFEYTLEDDPDIEWSEKK